MTDEREILKVVLVDDERIILDGLKRILDWEKYGCQVVATAADGLEGILAVRKHRPDILLTDIRMPNLDGLSMLAALKSELPGLQITVLTAYRDFDYAQQAIKLGVTRYLLKPSKMPELKEAVEEMAHRCREMAPGSAGSGPDEASGFVLRKAMDLIREQFAGPISLQAVADQVYVSKWHLSKLINGQTGKSFLHIVNGLRVDKAVELMKDPARQIGEIAELVGFATTAHFSKVFKQIRGVSPAAWRKLH